MAVRPYEGEMDMETGFDEQLAELTDKLYNIMRLWKGRVRRSWTRKNKTRLTGNPPIDFNSFGRVTQLRVNATTLVLEKMVPLNPVQWLPRSPQTS